ncbi:methyltransferase family protein [Clavibacter nebraskensis]|nr:isoprenylcysteine carboxylmethyltransferase family protein [Clavibacter nebraskensis]
MLAVLLSLAGATEIVFAGRGNGAASPRGVATDRLMQIMTVLAIAGPPLTSLVFARAPSVVAVGAGCALATGGLVLRVAAMRALGSRFQLTPRPVAESPALVVAGLYHVVRHPGYTALLMFFAGTSLVGGGLAGLAFVAPLVAGVLVRIRVEEAILRQEFGPTHVAYVEDVRWLLVPMVR